MLSCILSSEDRVSGTSSTGRLNLSETLNGLYRAESVNIANTVLNFPSGSNIIYVFYGTAQTATVPVGNYTSANVASTVQTALRTDIDNGFNVSYSTVTKKLTISHASAFYMNWEASTGNDCAKQLGFIPDTNTTSGTSVTAPYVINLVSSQAILFDIAEASNHIASSSLNSNGRGTIYIPLEVQFGTYQTTKFSDMENYVYFDKPQKNITYTLYDTSGSTVDLSGTNWQLYLTKVFAEDEYI